jgi:glycosyltransferase involved in cell wall biosynthesis
MAKNILMISPVPTHPQNAGNRARIYNLADSIKKLGHKLHFAYINRENADIQAMMDYWGEGSFFQIPYVRPKKLKYRVLKKIRSLFFKDARYVSSIDEPYDDGISVYLKKIRESVKVDSVIVEYVFFSKAFNCFPDHVHKIVDTHDVMAQRHKLYLKNNQKYNWFSTTARQERKGIKRAHTVIAIQEKEKAYFSHLTNRKVVTIGHSVELKAARKAFSGNYNVLFIGSANQSNIDAIDYFCNQIIPMVQSKFPDIKVLIAGPICRVFNHSMANIVKLGTIDHLEEAYRSTDVVINPIRFGTGLKIKNIEALGFSKPLITTSIGADGIESGRQNAFLVADEPKSFAKAVIDVFSNDTLYNSLAKNGYDFAKKWNKTQSDALSSLLNGAQ